MSAAVQILTNPANRQQRLVLYSNGVIDARGGAVPPAQWTFSFNDSYQFAAPIFVSGDPAVAFQVIDWTIPSGYTIDKFGFIYPWGAAVPVLGQTPPFTGGPEYLFGTGGAPFASPTYGFVIDLMMDPANSGKGYFLQYDGNVIAVGTGVTPVPHFSGQLAPFAARRLVMDWASKRYWVLDTNGRLSAYNGANGGVQVAGIAFPGYLNGGESGSAIEGDVVLYDTSATPKGWVVDFLGTVWPVNSAVVPLGYAPRNGTRGWTGLDIVNDGTTGGALRLVELRDAGTEFEFVSSTAPTVTVALPTGTLTADSQPWVRWVFSDQEGNAQADYDVRVLPSAQYLAGATSEVQTITVTGAPTGGTFTVSFRGYTSAAIARNAPAATVQALLESMPSIGIGNVTCSGGPLGTAAVTCTFGGALAAANLPQMTTTASFTGGTSPAATVATTTNGVDVNPATKTASWQTAGVDARTFEARTGVVLANGTYRAYVRAADSSGLFSPWAYSQFVVNVTKPNTPTVTASPTNGAFGVYGVNVGLSVSTAGLNAAARFGVQYHDSDWDGSTWQWVKNGFGIVPVSGAASLNDREARFGVARTYRAVVYIADTVLDTWNGSDWSATASATAGPRNVWTLTNAANPTSDTVVAVQEFRPARKVVAGAFETVGGDVVVVSDGAPRLPRFDLRVWLKTTAQRTAVLALFEADAVLLLRNPFGEAFYVKPSDGDLVVELLRAAPTVGEVTSIRDFRSLSVPVQTVERPAAGPTFGPFAEV